jgi:hypothetical protein
MSLDRTWYNTLVDDDGSGLTGSIWDKADVNALMNAIDAELGRLDIDGVWVDFTPSLYAAAGTWSAAAPRIRYRRDGAAGKQITLMYSIENGTLSSATSSISLQLPLIATAWAGTPANPGILNFSGLQEASMPQIPASKSVITIYRITAQNFPAGGGLNVYGQIVYDIP